MNASPQRLCRGNTSTERLGLVFFRYNRGREVWVTPERFEIERENKKVIQARRRAKPEHREKMKLYFRMYNHLPKQKEYHSRFYKQPHVRAKIRKIHAHRIATDPQYRIAMACRSIINSSLRRRNIKKKSKTEALIGCSFEFFCGWIEKQFTDGMSWANFGSGSGQWEIDHESPIALFDLTIEAECCKVFHYSNCRPMWAAENRTKNDFINHNGQQVRARELRKTIPFEAAA